jgi:hypothetical protein
MQIVFERWRGAIGHLDPERLVFIDEIWIKTNMAPIRGWGTRGERLKGFAPDGRWRTLTLPLSEPTFLPAGASSNLLKLTDIGRSARFAVLRCSGKRGFMQTAIPKREQRQET